MTGSWRKVGGGWFCFRRWNRSKGCFSVGLGVTSNWSTLSWCITLVGAPDVLTPCCCVFCLYFAQFSFSSFSAFLFCFGRGSSLTVDHSLSTSTFSSFELGRNSFSLGIKVPVFYWSQGSSEIRRFDSTNLHRPVPYPIVCVLGQAARQVAELAIVPHKIRESHERPTPTSMFMSLQPLLFVPYNLKFLVPENCMVYLLLHPTPILRQEIWNGRLKSPATLTIWNSGLFRCTAKELGL